ERARLHGERDAIFTQQQELENKLSAVNRELQAIEAYETARSGKAGPTRAGAARSSTAPKQARRGSRREEIVQAVRSHGAMSRGELLGKLGGKGDKTVEMAVSNALTALTKSGQLTRAEGKYHLN